MILDDLITKVDGMREYICPVMIDELIDSLERDREKLNTSAVLVISSMMDMVIYEFNDGHRLDADKCNACTAETRCAPYTELKLASFAAKVREN